MRRTLITVGLVVALMGLSISALADDHENGENGFVASISNGVVTFNNDILTIEELEFDNNLEETHGHYVAAAVYLLKSYEADGTFDPGQYRLGCLVKHYAQSDLGKGESDSSTVEIEYEDCLKKKFDEDWTPPGWEKKGPDWTPPGWENKPDNDS